MTSLLATDNLNVGRVAADALAVAITRSYADTEGDVAMITSMPGVASLEQRAKGFKEVVAAKYGAMDITADKVADGKPATVLNIMKDLIANTADLRGVFVSDPIMTLTVGQAVAERNRKLTILSSGNCRRKARTFCDFFSATAWPTVSVMIGSETNTPRRSAVLAMRSFIMLRTVAGLPSATFIGSNIHCPIFAATTSLKPFSALLERSNSGHGGDHRNIAFGSA